MHVPKHFWADDVSTTCFLINRMPSLVLDRATPFQTLFPQKSLFPIESRVFRCTCFVQDVRLHVSKLDPKSLKCIFLGCSRVQKGYRCYCHSLRRYMVSADATFLENTHFSSYSIHTSQREDDDLLVYTLALPTHASIPPLTKPPITQVYARRLHPPVSSPPPAASTSNPIISDNLPIALRKSKRRCTHPISSFCSYNHLSSHSCLFIASLDFISLPNKVSEALVHPGWRSAMIDEMNALNDNGTCDLVCLPTGNKVIGCQWMFTVKVNPDGSIARLKACLVAKGYTQTYGVDYSNTFSPVAKLTSIRLVISPHGWDLHQLDIKNVFLHENLVEEVYMEQPLRFVAKGEIGRVYRLRKSGLKQGPHA